MRAPDYHGLTNIKAWRLPNLTPQKPDHTATLATFLIESPEGMFHAFWNRWALNVVHLRDIPGVKPATIYELGATHEIMIVSINPDQPKIDPDAGQKIDWMSPPDVVQQFQVDNDRQAVRVGEMMIEAIVKGLASPDVDYRSFWKRQIPQLAAHAKGEHGH